jgi:hypothetical protein
MNATTAVFVVAILACIVIAAFVVFRQRGKVDLRGPFGTGVNLEMSNEEKAPSPAVSVKDAISRQGGILAEDNTGRGAKLENVEVQDDILVSSNPAIDPKDYPRT